MSTDTPIMSLLDLWTGLYRRAWETYRDFACRADSPSLRALWNELADDEARQLEDWERLRAETSAVPLTEICIDLEALQAELAQLPARLDSLQQSYLQHRSPSQAFLLALGLEYYLYRPALFELRRLLEGTDAANAAETRYREHLDRLVAAVEHTDVTPEVGLLGEAIHRLWRLSEQISAEALTDPLTGVLNRRGLEVAVKPLLFLARRNRQHIGLLMADMDDFKQVNDRHGHLEGDRALKAVAYNLRAALRSSDVVCRYGGEEFLLALMPVRPDSLTRVADKLLATVRQQLDLPYHLTLSIGAACGRGDEDLSPGAWLTDLIGRADAALLRAKAAGKDCAIVAD